MNELQPKDAVVFELPQSKQQQANTKQYASPVADGSSTGVYASSGLNFSLRSLRAAAEIHGITLALQHTGWNRKRAARLLSISYRGLLYKIRQYSITPGAKASYHRGSEGIPSNKFRAKRMQDSASPPRLELG